MNKQYVVGVDVGGQTTKIGVVDARGDVLTQTVIRSDIYGSDADAYIKAGTIIPERLHMHRTLPGLPVRP